MPPETYSPQLLDKAIKTLIEIEDQLRQGNALSFNHGKFSLQDKRDATISEAPSLMAIFEQLNP